MQGWPGHLRDADEGPVLFDVSYAEPGPTAGCSRHRAESVARGDIVVVTSVELGQMIIKRVIGEPGDWSSSTITATSKSLQVPRVRQNRTVVPPAPLNVAYSCD